MSASSVQQSDSDLYIYIYIYIYILFLWSLPLYVIINTRYWVEFPVLYSKSLFVVCFICGSVYVNPKLLIYPSSSFPFEEIMRTIGMSNQHLGPDVLVGAVILLKLRSLFAKSLGISPHTQSHTSVQVQSHCQETRGYSLLEFKFRTICPCSALNSGVQ